MKSHLAKLSLTLLSAAFLLGCQDQGSGPVGLEDLGVQLKRGGKPGKGGGGGTVNDFTVTLAGDLGASGQVMQAEKDNKKYLRLSSESFTVTVSFDVLFDVPFDDPDGFSLPNEDGDNSETGKCVLSGVPDDLTGFHSSVTEISIAAVLRRALTQSSGGRFNLQIHKPTLGDQHHDNVLLIGRGFGSPANNLLNETDGSLIDDKIVGLQWGRNQPSNGDFMKVEFDGDDPNDPSLTRVFNLSLGTVRMSGRLNRSPPDDSPIAELICDVIDPGGGDTGGQATVTVAPLPPN